MTEETAFLRKEIRIDQLVSRIPEIEDINYWRSLTPDAVISDFPFQGWEKSPQANQEKLDEYISQLREEAYFQTEPIIPTATLQEMLQCVENVKKAGFPPMFALVYDVFYKVFVNFNSVLTSILGPGYQMIPNFWFYYIETSDHGKGFEPHRDAEYANTIDANGMPTVLTLWITLTEAKPLNSCMYLVPSNRDPQYTNAIHDLKVGATEFALEDIRALPTPAGVLSCWDQYVFHWGSRSSKRAQHPRISYALYCQRGDIAPVDNIVINLPSAIDFNTRIALICRGLYRYSYLSLKASKEDTPLLAFMEKYMALLSLSE